MQLDYRFSPDLTELNEGEVERLGLLTQHPDWPLFVKYLHIERWATLNNGFIREKDLAGFGYCQGDIGRINKIESDMRRYGQIAMAKKSIETAQREHDAVANSTFAEYNDDVDLPLAP